MVVVAAGYIKASAKEFSVEYSLKNARDLRVENSYFRPILNNNKHFLARAALTHPPSSVTISDESVEATGSCLLLLDHREEYQQCVLRSAAYDRKSPESSSEQVQVGGAQFPVPGLFRL